MSQDLDCTQLTSKTLSEVLFDIGLNDRVVEKKKETYLLHESLDTLESLLEGKVRGSLYIFGSQSEGTTTPGLQSDCDNLVCLYNFLIIQDLKQWKPGEKTYLMIEDKKLVSPGYCLLQLLRTDDRCSETVVPDELHFKDRSGRILLRNTAFREMTKTTIESVAAFFSSTVVTHGPANSISMPATSHSDDKDIVYAFQCESWPKQARQWDCEGRWPSKCMKRDCSNSGCFVVPVGSKASENFELEWRMSTSLAERYLMFSLNITQIRCYVLMKMFLKTYIKPHFEDAISSFMCKTLLFHTIANTQSNFWRESNLISCFSWCLLVLYNYVLHENCPHFIISGNNLMAGHITHESKPKILGKLLHIIKNIKEALLKIDCDDLGARLLNIFDSKNRIYSGDLSFETAINVNRTAFSCLKSLKTFNKKEAVQTLLKYIFRLINIYYENGSIKQYKEACTFLLPRFYTALGCVLATLSIEQDNSISASAIGCISKGLDTDVSSSKLKQASMFYCIGDSQRTEKILGDIDEKYDTNIVEPTCGCYSIKNQFPKLRNNNEKKALHEISASCVIYLQCEKICIPHELVYEMFRSINEDRDLEDELWMDLAVVDSLPYLYFLQYKTYSNLKRQNDKQRALTNLVNTIWQEPYLQHRETALNLLGQCMEGEDKANIALHCYSLSLKIRRRNNAANIHICRLLSKLVNDPARN